MLIDIVKNSYIFLLKCTFLAEILNENVFVKDGTLSLFIHDTQLIKIFDIRRISQPAV